MDNERVSTFIELTRRVLEDEYMGKIIRRPGRNVPGVKPTRQSAKPAKKLMRDE